MLTGSNTFGPGDGCTLWWDEWAGTSWRHCCDVHDLAYEVGLPKIPADLELASCVAQTGYGVMALVMLAGVTLLGWIFHRRRVDNQQE